uniref:Enoyl-CoA hydratase n=1 Tax=Amphora coffeiformis TaxID=265554 RepID=A0A7S3LEG1_9STRA|mmetsp:Transcript_114/g.240  ORF Transcript_114/g.240 Transcript_114/m.240 type:complete len:296 (+) Transcript_114:77-964(+)
MRLVCSIQRHRLCAVQASRWMSRRSFSSFSEILVDHRRNENLPNVTVSILTMNRPKANAMSKNMLHELKEQLKSLQIDYVSNSRCLIITSFSDRVFSAGADLKERKTMTPSEADAFVTDLRQTMEQISNLPIPVIAAVEGAALGGGLELALAADFRIVSKTATLGLPETSLAIIPGAGGTQRLSRLIGPTKAKKLIFTAARLTGEEASEMGLVDQLTDPGETLDQSLDLAWKIAKNGPVAIRAAKEAINKGMCASTMQEALDIERECYGKVLPTKDRLEGLVAFQEGRVPEYKGE